MGFILFWGLGFAFLGFQRAVSESKLIHYKQKLIFKSMAPDRHHTEEKKSRVPKLEWEVHHGQF